ncbi:hypothetical protein GGG16DRAFT_119759, partial [Schizophyllum commune]
MTPLSAPPEPPSPSFSHPPPILSIAATVIPANEFPDAQGQAPAHLEPPINGTLDAPTQIGETTRRLDEAAARGEFPGRIFVFSGRGASLGGGRDRHGRYAHDVAIPSATCMSSDPNGRHSTTMEDVFVRCFTQTAPSVSNDPLLEPGSNGIDSHPPSLEELQRILPQRDDPNNPSLIRCNVPVVTDTSRVPARPFTPIYGASSLPPYYAPRMWLGADAQHPSAVGETHGYNTDGQRVLDNRLAQGIDPARTMGTQSDDFSAVDVFQPAVLAAFADASELGGSSPASSTPVLPYVSREDDRYEPLHPRFPEGDLDPRSARSVSPVEHRASNAMVIDSPRWIPESPADSDFQRLYEGRAAEDTPPWECFLQYPEPSPVPEASPSATTPATAETSHGALAIPGAAEASDPLEDVPLTAVEPDAPYGPAACARGISLFAPDAEAAAEQQKSDLELTPEQRLVLFMRAMPSQSSSGGLLLKSPPTTSVTTHIVPSVSATADLLAPLQLNEALNAAAAALAAAAQPVSVVQDRHGEPTTGNEDTEPTATPDADFLPRADTPHPNSGIYHRPAKRSRGSNDATDLGARLGTRFRGKERVAAGERLVPAIASPSPQRVAQERPPIVIDSGKIHAGNDIDSDADRRRRMGFSQYSGAPRRYVLRTYVLLRQTLMFLSIRIPTERGRLRIWTSPGPSPLGEPSGSEATPDAMNGDDKSMVIPPNSAPHDVEMRELPSSPLASPPMFSELDRAEWSSHEAAPHPFSFALSHPPFPQEARLKDEPAPSPLDEAVAMSGALDLRVSDCKTEVRTPSLANRTPSFDDGVGEATGSRTAPSSWPAYDGGAALAASNNPHSDPSGVATCAPPPPWRVFAKDDGCAMPIEDPEDDGLTDRDAEGDPDEETIDRWASESDTGERASDMDVDERRDPDDSSPHPTPESDTAEIDATARRLRALARRLHASAARTFDAAGVVYEAASSQLEHVRIARAVDEMRETIASLLDEEVPAAGINKDNLLARLEESGAFSAASTSSSSEGHRRGDAEARSDSTSPLPFTPPPSPSEGSMPELQSQESSRESLLPPRGTPGCADETPADLARLPHTPFDPEPDPNDLGSGTTPEGSPPDYSRVQHGGGLLEALHRTPPPPSVLLPEPEAITLTRIFHKALTHALTAHNVLHEGEVDSEEVEVILREITRQLQEDVMTLTFSLTYEHPQAPT